MKFHVLVEALFLLYFKTEVDFFGNNTFDRLD